MDNLTHSLAGLALGELTHRVLPAEADAGRASTRRRLLLTCAALASNFPDLDLVLTPLAPEPLGYLLHHRGHTHTLLYALPQALVLLAALWLLWPAARTLLRSSGAARLGVAASIVLGLLLHFGMDAMNVYGIHPFAPFDPRWFYGDMVFIVEPVFWVALGTPLAAHVARPWLRRVFLALLLLVPGLFTLFGFLQWGSFGALAAIWLLSAWLTRRAGERTALVAGVAVVLGFVLVQAGSARLAEERVAAALRRGDAGLRIYDTALSAFPTNPLCWTVISVSGSGGDDYRVRRGVLSLAPGLDPVTACPFMIHGEYLGGTADGLAWAWEEEGSKARLRALREEDCRIDAWLRFARTPSLAGGRATDVRYAPRGERNFSTLDYGAKTDGDCAWPLPKWGYPRADLLGLP